MSAAETPPTAATVAALCPCASDAPPGIASPAPEGSPTCGAPVGPADTFTRALDDGTTEQRPGAWMRCERGHQWRPMETMGRAGRRGKREALAATTRAIVPYYEAEGVTIYNAPWEDVVAAGLVPVREVALIHADPSYGVSYDPKMRRGSAHMAFDRSGRARGVPQEREYPKLHGDDKPHDPRPLLALDRPTVTWGANHYCDRLPRSSSWLSWDKRADTGSDDGSDVELAWSNLGGPARRFVHLWRGTCRASETGTRHLWATQKPEALSAYVFEWARRRKVGIGPGSLLFVPYMGSFPDYRPWRALGGRIIACDVSEEACQIAVSARILAAPRNVKLGDLGPLFAGVT